MTEMISRRVMPDTNVLLNNVEILDDYSEICICVAIIDELDKIKERSQQGDLKLKGRIASRYINSNLDRIKIVEDNMTFVKENLIYDCVDQIIVSSAKYYNCLILTNDLNCQHRAEALDLEWKSCIKLREVYTGHLDLYVSPETIDNLYRNRVLAINEKYVENMCITLISSSDEKNKALSIYKKGNLHLVDNKQKHYGISPKNKDQQYAMALLADDSVPIVCIDSPLGTGKSFLSCAVGLQKVLNENKYDSLLYTKPLEPMGGKDIGYLKNDKNDKLLNGYSGTIINTLENIERANNKAKSMSFGDSFAEELINRGQLEVEAITFMRGMSYSKKYIIIDESSNLDLKDLANICGRIGENSKIVIIGCSRQVDNIRLNSENNGLTLLIDRLKDSEYFATVRMNKIVRSDVASLIVERLEDILS